LKPVLLDTGCIVALLDRSETHHAQCVEVVTRMEAPLVTCEAVIAESCDLLIVPKVLAVYFAISGIVWS
jgi:predicted nucleic acid-binding protein